MAEKKLDAVREIEASVLPESKNIFEIDGKHTYDQLLFENVESYEANIDENDSTFILYTSGTADRPKGAVISNINVVHSVMNYSLVLETDDSIKTAIVVSMFHVTGLVGQVLHMFYIGGTVYSIRRYQNEEYIERVLLYKINFLFNVPTIFTMMFTSKAFNIGAFDFVKKVAYGGSPIYHETF